MKLKEYKYESHLKLDFSFIKNFPNLILKLYTGTARFVNN